MTPAEAEAILALNDEIATALELRLDEAAFRSDWRVRFAAERVIERVFQATEAIDADRRESYFGVDGARYLRGLRNRLSHNYLATDYDIIWETISVDLPAVSDRLSDDATAAKTVLADAIAESAGNEDEWRGAHLRPTRNVDN
ncbi:hypothetical protein B7R21_07620 [Subtercola boreus]|uniref:DUF86 domain-containing protein n=1 Tax=Subtercola boreus TaxID=120213 RepID=A0A3E0VW34_9MICO|nr:HepT-like ribonuclease domain-containing protein [Subtercola boreus]RFA13920.1 hypothetical protein B7R21_07620 [Subtercola boreus]